MPHLSRLPVRPTFGPRLRPTAILALALAGIASAIGSTSAAPDSALTGTAPSPGVNALILQARALDATEPARAISLAREALALAQKNPPRTDELFARAQLSESLRRNSNYDEAQQVIDAGFARPLGHSPTEQLAHAQLVYQSGQLHWNRGDYVSAEECYLRVQQVAETLGQSSLLIRVLNSRGIVARHQKLFDQSEQHFRAALALADKHGESELRLQIRNNLAILLYDQHRFDEARPLLLENLRAHTASDNRRSMANALVNLGSLENTAANPAAALPYFEKALALRLELGVPRHVASARIAVATTLARLGRGDAALEQLRAAAPLAEKVGSHEILGNLYTAFSEAHAARDDFREALDYQHKAGKENDTVASEKTAAAVAELRERFDAEKRQRQIAELHAAQQKKDADLAAKDAELRRTRAERVGLAGLLALGVVAASAVISRQRAITRAERRILAETRRARDAAEEAAALKSKLLDLASHDLKAPLVGTMMTAELIAEESIDRPAIAERAQALHAKAAACSASSKTCSTAPRPKPAVSTSTAPRSTSPHSQGRSRHPSPTELRANSSASRSSPRTAAHASRATPRACVKCSKTS